MWQLAFVRLVILQDHCFEGDTTENNHHESVYNGKTHLISKNHYHTLTHSPQNITFITSNISQWFYKYINILRWDKIILLM